MALQLLRKSDAPILMTIASIPLHARTPRIISELMGLSYTYTVQKITGYRYRGYVRAYKDGVRTMYHVPMRGVLFKCVEMYFGISPTDAVKDFDKYMEKFKHEKGIKEKRS